MRAQRVATCAATFLLAACAGSGEGLDENGRPIGGETEPLLPQFDSIQSKVFTPVCVTCHAGAAAPLGFRLDEGASYAMLVNAPSVEVPALNRVIPGDPDASYLIQKIEGTAAVGGRMPLDGPPLPADTIAVIRQWISDGALPSSTAELTDEVAAGAASMEALWPISGAVLHGAPHEVVLSSNAQLDVTLLNAGTITLYRSRASAGFTDADPHAVRATIAVRSLDPTVIALTAPAHEWIPGEYELRVSGSAPVAVADLASHPIDGDGDGMPGGDFILHFSLEARR